MIWKIILTIACYFIGNISPSTIMAKRKGLDIKKEGSGNAGTTNALRVLGKKAAAVTLLIDCAKGVLCAVLGTYIFDITMGCICSAAVFLGHIFPVVYKFKGGKGAATGIGAMFVLNWIVALIVLGVAILGVLISKKMSVGSILGAIACPIASYFIEIQVLPFAIFVMIVILIKHRSNIVRIFKGEEPKLSFFEKNEKHTEKP